MKPEQLLQAMGEIREDLIPEAMPTPRKSRFRSRGFLAAAACFALVLALGLTAYATGALDGLLQYFKGNTEPYLEDLEESQMATSNDEMALRVDAAVADDSNLHMLLSLTGLTEEAKQALTKDDTNNEFFHYTDQYLSRFIIYAKTKDGKFIDFYDINYQFKSIKEPGEETRSLLPDTDLTIPVHCMFKDYYSMSEVDKIYIHYRDMTLELDIAPYIVPQYTLQPEDAANARYQNIRVSDLGFVFDAPIIRDDDDHRDVHIGDIKLIRADGTTTDAVGGWQTRYYEGETTAHVFGRWNSDYEVIELVNIREYRGLQIGEEIYLFEE